MADLFQNGDVKLFLDFISDGSGRVEICDPVGFPSLSPTLLRDDDRLGIDVFFAGGDLELEFNALAERDGLTHRFDRLIANWLTYGTETEIKFIIEIKGVDRYTGELSFNETTETDLVKVFKCRVIQESLQATIKRRSDISVNLFADEDLDGNAITPLATTSVLLKATPEKQISEWILPSSVQNSNATVTGTTFFYFSITPQIKSSFIDFTGYPRFFLSTLPARREDALLLNSFANLSNVSLKISDFTYAIAGRLATNNDPRAITTFFNYRVGIDFDTATEVTTEIPNSGTSYELTTAEFSIPRNNNLWAWFTVTSDTGDSLLYDIDFTSLSITAEAISTAIDSITQSFRFIDVINQVVTSISGATVDAPRFDVGGEFYNDFSFNGTLIRGITDRAFNISLDDIQAQLKEINGDYQIRPDGTIFFGIYDDFYPDVEIADLTDQPFLSYRNKANVRHFINKLNYKYKKYEKGQDEDTQNSLEGIHTECQMSLPNVRSTKPLDIEVPFSRDAFLIEKVRRQGVEVSDDVAKDDDDDFFMIDVYEETGVIAKSEGMLINQTITSTTVLNIANDGKFSFNLLGMTIGDTVSFTTQETGQNAGDYNVVGFSQGSIDFAPISPTPNPTYEGVSYITLNYNVTATDLVTATDQDFSFISGTSDASGISNMRYSTKRNILNYYGKHLKTACQRHLMGVIKNTLYRHNGAFTSQLDTETGAIREDQDIDVSDLATAILKDTETVTDVFMDLEQATSIINTSQSTGGYVTVLNSLGEEVKVHPSKLEYNVEKGLLRIEGEDRI